MCHMSGSGAGREPVMPVTLHTTVQYSQVSSREFCRAAALEQQAQKPAVLMGEPEEAVVVTALLALVLALLLPLSGLLSSVLLLLPLAGLPLAPRTERVCPERAYRSPIAKMRSIPVK